jgi:hypothetical protein
MSNQLGTLMQQLTMLVLAPMLLSPTGVTILATATVQRVRTRRHLSQTTQIILATLITQVRTMGASGELAQARNGFTCTQPGCMHMGRQGISNTPFGSNPNPQSLSSFCNRLDSSTVICNVMAGADKYS